MIELSYLDIRPVLTKVADLQRGLVLVGGQAVNFWAAYYAPRVPELAEEAPFTSKDIDFCGDQHAMSTCAERLGGKARVATFDDATPNSGTVVFVDDEGVVRTLDVVSAPFDLDGEESGRLPCPSRSWTTPARTSAPPSTSCTPFSRWRVASIMSSASAQYDTERGRKQLRASILCAREFLRESSTARWTRPTPRAQ